MIAPDPGNLGYAYPAERLASSPTNFLGSLKKAGRMGFPSSKLMSRKTDRPESCGHCRNAPIQSAVSQSQQHLIPPPQQSWKDGFGRRLGVFLAGIAIGLVFLGFFQRMKQNAAHNQQAQPSQQIESQPHQPPLSGADPPARSEPAAP